MGVPRGTGDAGRTRGAPGLLESWCCQPGARRGRGAASRGGRGTSGSPRRRIALPQGRKLVRGDLKSIWPGFKSLCCIISYKIFHKLISLNLNFLICKTDVMVSIWQGWPRRNLNVVCKSLAKCRIPRSGHTTSTGSLLYEFTVH